MNRKRILIAAVDHSLRVRLRRLLEAAGYDVSTATDGGKALLQLTIEPVPSLILVDLNLPPAGGTDLASSLAGRPGWAAIPIVLITTADLDAAPGTLAVVRGDSSDDDILVTVRRYCLGVKR